MDFAPLSPNLLAEATKQIVGERRIDMYQTFKTNSRNAGRQQRFGNFMSFLGNAATDYLFSNFSQIVMGSVLQLYMFDWAQTDEQIQQQMKANELSAISALGRLTADGVVRMAGLGATKMAKHKYPQLDPHALASLEEDQRDEIVQSLRGSFLAMRSTLVNNAFLSTYTSGRQMMGFDGKKKSEPWILSDQIQKIAENQKTPEMKAYLTGLIDQAEDAIFDIAFLACNTVQSTYELTRLATKAAQGPNRVVKFTMDKDNPEEYTWVYGPQQNVINAIETAKIEGAVIASKDIGQIVQVGLDQALKAQRNERKVTAYFYSGANGASRLPDGKRAAKKEIRIPRVKLSCDWDKLKSVLVPFDGGNFKVICHLNDGHQLHGFFATEAEGKSYLQRIADNLCEGNPVKWTTIEPNSDPKFRLDTGRFTVSSATIRIAKETSDPAKKSLVDANGQYWKVKSIKLPLRKATKPDGIDAKILNPWAAETP
jgi:hypothetical protein